MKRPPELQLTQVERYALLHADECQLPKLTFNAGERIPVDIPHVQRLTAHVKLEVTGTRRAKDGKTVLLYTLHDKRMGQRYLSRRGTEHGYTHTGGSDVDREAGEAVDEFTQKRITREARGREQAEIGKLLAAMEDVRSALDDRVKANPEAAKTIGRELWQLRGRIDAAKARLKRRMAA